MEHDERRNAGGSRVDSCLDSARCGLTVEDVRRDIMDSLAYLIARPPALATLRDWSEAVAYSVRNRLVHRFMEEVDHILRHDARIAVYLSAEYLPGPHLANHLLNLGLEETYRQAGKELGFDLDAVIAKEVDPGLGNGGLGRLAACFLDSLATLGVPSIGYGLRYEFGLFSQEIVDGRQVERTDKWLSRGNPWEFVRPEISHEVKVGGRTRGFHDASGAYRVEWTPELVVKGVACTTIISGYRSKNVSLMNLWKAEAVESFDYDAFSGGDYLGAVREKAISETISKILYPNDETFRGKRLRLAQQYFFVSCSMQDLLRLCRIKTGGVDALPDLFSVQLNDTHPAVAVAELMRLLIDEHGLEWDRAWDMATRIFAYTNHTLLPEALETWPLPLFASTLPRHMEIVFEINRRFLDEVRDRFPGDEERVRRMSIIDESGERRVRMAHLACVGSRKINGVSRLHSELVASSLLRDFHDMWPEKFVNVTNGVTPRRWMGLCNPGLRGLIDEAIGDDWLNHLETELSRLEPFAEDAAFREKWRAIKRANKVHLAELIRDKTGASLDPDACFDVQVKRIHEYKRQHLNALRAVHHYLRIKDGERSMSPRAIIFGGKAAPSYFMAKLIIRLANGLAETINADKDAAGLLSVAFAPNFNVTTGQTIYPATDLSEQISTAGKEASGTGNMKFTLNGALTVGTLDGANVEIREAVGEENFFLFGLTTEEVHARKAQGYRPRELYESTPELRRVLDAIGSGLFSRGDEGLFRPLVDDLLHRDEYLVLADFAAYLACQDQVDAAWSDPDRWTRMSILNVARSGRFSSDRSIRDYCRDIWGIAPRS